jgi:hypothetical protein
MLRFLCLLVPLGASLLVGCATGEVAEASPTVRLIRGQLHPADYAGEVTRANEATRDAEQFEVNREATRAYNTATGRYEFVPEDSEQRWNEEEQRWEFSPADPARAASSPPAGT